jgi:hypothetical protein
LFKFLKQGEAFKKGLANLFSERASMPRWKEQEQG